ncbi:MAG: DUF4262 domain-containing protein [Capnocytophaga sp.]|nr:DUF4262 domain-containing protein [Capnocytophaga sp.]
MNTKKLLQDIEQYGFEVIMIPPTDYLPSFAYTVGLWKNYQSPEIIVFGLPVETMHIILNTVVNEEIKAGKPIKTGSNYMDVLQDFPVQFLSVDKRNISDYFGQAIAFYQTANFPALQLVWPDNKGIFPFEKNFEESFIYLQPLLDRNADFKFREDRNRAVFTTSSWLENQSFINEVIHDQEGDWFFLTEGEVDKDFELRLITLEQMLQYEPTLNQFFDLDYNERAFRNSAEEEWVRMPV